MNRSTRILAVAVVLLLAGCGQYEHLLPGQVKIGGGLTVDTPIDWSQLSAGDQKIWTVDGQLLQILVFVTGLEDGNTLLQRGLNTKLPVFKPSMTAIEIADLFKNSFATLNVRDMRILNLRPARFGNADGFRFEFDYRSTDGIERTGLAIGAVRNRKLNLIYYRGTKILYFDKYKNEVEKIISSARFS